MKQLIILGQICEVSDGMAEKLIRQGHGAETKQDVDKTLLSPVPKYIETMMIDTERSFEQREA